jgi:hypothetical protein
MAPLEASGQVAVSLDERGAGTAGGCLDRGGVAAPAPAQLDDERTRLPQHHGERDQGADEHRDAERVRDSEHHVLDRGELEDCVHRTSLVIRVQAPKRRPPRPPGIPRRGPRLP